LNPPNTPLLATAYSRARTATFGDKMMTYYLYRALDGLNPLVHLIGLGIAVWAYYRGRKRGYVLVAINFPLGPILLVTGLWLIARREKGTEQ